MVIVNEKTIEYRFKDSGPKYLLRGPKIDFGLVRLKPGEEFPAHYHNEVEENFFILKGEIFFRVGREEFIAREGDLVNCAPKEAHYLLNKSDKPATAIFVKAPSIETDKVNI